MQELAKADQKVSRRVLTRDEAVKFFKHQGEIYKAEIIASIPDKDEISLYGQGDWVDLCRGPHVPSTGKLKAFKLTKVAGAYWRGDSRNPMLQRIYGTAWSDQKELDEFLKRTEEAKADAELEPNDDPAHAEALAADDHGLGPADGPGSRAGGRAIRLAPGFTAGRG